MHHKYGKAGPHVNCNCPEPCEDKIYSTTNSHVTLSRDFYSYLTAKYGESDAYWKENVAGLMVYYPELIEENVIHQKSFSLMSLFCNIGGVFGLILGAGLISIIEVFDFLCSKGLSKMGTKKI